MTTLTTINKLATMTTITKMATMTTMTTMTTMSTKATMTTKTATQIQIQIESDPPMKSQLVLSMRNIFSLQPMMGNPCYCILAVMDFKELTCYD